ncbi:hypothetical protein AB0M20_29550, partial [Actinoplanes sp. NPDC051633]|uniref:hypothetical protein n=1 Tax=Actinoplanes sp. NPDC051633 TaxID=3155670 RepID=UPI003429CECB
MRRDGAGSDRNGRGPGTGSGRRRGTVGDSETGGITGAIPTVAPSRVAIIRVNMKDISNVNILANL